MTFQRRLDELGELLEDIEARIEVLEDIVNLLIDEELEDEGA